MCKQIPPIGENHHEKIYCQLQFGSHEYIISISQTNGMIWDIDTIFCIEENEIEEVKRGLLPMMSEYIKKVYHSDIERIINQPTQNGVPA